MHSWLEVSHYSWLNHLLLEDWSDTKAFILQLHFPSKSFLIKKWFIVPLHPRESVTDVRNTTAGSTTQCVQEKGINENISGLKTSFPFRVPGDSSKMCETAGTVWSEAVSIDAHYQTVSALALRREIQKKSQVTLMGRMEK